MLVKIVQKNMDIPLPPYAGQPTRTTRHIHHLSFIRSDSGVGFVLRKFAAVAKSTMTIAVEGEKVRIITKGPKDSEVFFTLGEEFNSKDPQDNPVKAIAKWENGGLITDARPVDPSRGKRQLVERRIVNDDLEMKITVNNVICKRIFKKNSS